MQTLYVSVKIQIQIPHSPRQTFPAGPRCKNLTTDVTEFRMKLT